MDLNIIHLRVISLCRTNYNKIIFFFLRRGKRFYGNLEPIFIYTQLHFIFPVFTYRNDGDFFPGILYLSIFYIAFVRVPDNNFPKMEVTLRSLEFPGSYRDTL